MVVQGLPKVQKLLSLLRPITGMVSLPLHATDERKSQARISMGRKSSEAHWGLSLETSRGIPPILVLHGEQQRLRGIK